MSIVSQCVFINYTVSIISYILMIISVCKKHDYLLCELCAERLHESPCLKYRPETFQYDCDLIGKDAQFDDRPGDRWTRVRKRWSPS